MKSKKMRKHRGFRLVPYKKSIAYNYPEVISFWDMEKNGISCSEIAPGCSYPFWWSKDEKSFQKAPLKVFANKSINLEAEKPSTKTRDSLPQNLTYQCILKYVSGTKYNIGVGRFTADIINEQMKFVVEYDGLHYHQESMEKDNRRNAFYLAKGYKVFDIRPKGLKSLERHENLFFLEPANESDPETKACAEKILHMLGVESPYNFDGIIATRLSNCGTPFEKTNPELMKILNHEKNEGINYNSLSKGSGEKLSFSKFSISPITGKLIILQWDARLEHMTENPNSNPYESNHEVIKGYNDFETFCKYKGDPDFLKYDYDYERNPDPSTIGYKSALYIYATCHECGKDLSGPVFNRTSGDKWHSCSCFISKQKGRRVVNLETG